MRRIVLHGLPLILLFAPLCPAQEILPPSVAGWNSSSASAAQPSAENWAQIAGPASAALKEYGATSAETRTYALGKNSLAVTVYTFGNTAGAYGAYSFLRTPDMSPAQLTQHSSISANRALALTGNIVVDFSGKNIRHDADAVELLVAQAGGHAKWGAYPALPQRLPTEGLIPRSDHFVWGPVALGQFLPLASGDWLGLSQGASAELARYHLAGHDSTLIIVDYPTPQMATAKLDQLKTQLGVISLDDSPNTSASAKPNSSALYARHDTTMLALVTNAPSAKAASYLLHQFSSGMVLTWNTEVIEKPEPSMVTIVIGTFVGAGEICLFTIFGGILFAVIRLLIKRFWPGRVFDRALDFEILELGLTGRPIKSNDFYQMKS